MKAKKSLVKKLSLNKSTISQLDTRELEQLKAGGNPWIEGKTDDPVICTG